MRETRCGVLDWRNCFVILSTNDIAITPCLRFLKACTLELAHAGLCSISDRADAWLCEFNLNEAATEQCVTREVADEVAGEIIAPDRPGCRSSRPTVGLRASDQGYLPITIERYLELLDWTGRALRAGKRGTIPVELSPILNRLGLNGECWLETVSHFGRWFKRAAGGRESLASAALRCGRRWFQGQAAARVAFQ